MVYSPSVSCVHCSYAAQQFHVAFSASLRGAGIIAGGPYYCAQGSLNTALLQCMSSDFFINVPQLVSAARECGNRGACDSVDHMQESKVWLFSGTLDATVVPGVMRKLLQFYEVSVLRPTLMSLYASSHIFILVPASVVAARW